jgi:preprotein translocase subunit SecY
MVGILARFPQHFIQEFTTRVEQQRWSNVIGYRNYWLLVIVACVLLTMAIRKIPVQYARRTTSGDFEQDMMGGNRQWIPLKMLLVLCRLSLLRLSCLYLRLCGLSKSDTSQSIVGAFSNMFGLV